MTANDGWIDHSRRRMAGIIPVRLTVAGMTLVVTQTAPERERSDKPARFSSVGERIYLTGRAADGGFVDAAGSHQHTAMIGGSGCVACHGSDRQGGRLWPNFWQVAPANKPRAPTTLRRTTASPARPLPRRSSAVCGRTASRLAPECRVGGFPNPNGNP